MSNLVPWSTTPEQRVTSPGLAAIRAALLRLDDERQALAEAGDFEALAMGGQDIGTIYDELGTLLRDVRLDVGRILDERERERRADERERRLEAGTPEGRLPKFLDPEVKLGPVRAEIVGVGAVEVNGGFDRKNWQSEKLLRLMLHVALDGFSIFTPDGTDARDEVIARLMEVLCDTMPVNASMQWRVGRAPKGKEPNGLKRYGIDDADFCDRTEKDRLASWPKWRD